jgi:hypothetical protein
MKNGDVNVNNFLLSESEDHELLSRPTHLTLRESMDKTISALGLSLREKLAALPSTHRSASVVNLGDVVWLVIRAHLRSRVLKCAGDALWSLMKFDLRVRRPKPAPRLSLSVSQVRGRDN